MTVVTGCLSPPLPSVGCRHAQGIQISTCKQVTYIHKIKIKKERNKRTKNNTEGGKTREKTEVKKRIGK